MISHNMACGFLIWIRQKLSVTHFVLQSDSYTFQIHIFNEVQHKLACTVTKDGIKDQNFGFKK